MVSLNRKQCVHSSWKITNDRLMVVMHNFCFLFRGNRLIKTSLIDFVNWSKNTSILANNFYSLNVWLSETEFYTCSDILVSMLLFLCLKGRSSIMWSSMLENLGQKIRIHINLGNVIYSQGTRYILKDYEWDKNCPITRDQRITSPCLKKNH